MSSIYFGVYTQVGQKQLIQRIKSELHFLKKGGEVRWNSGGGKVKSVVGRILR